MKNNTTKKKITRGITKDFAEAFKKSALNNLYRKHEDELFIGVRNNYLNLYYNCDSIAKIIYKKHTIRCEVNKYYLYGNKKINNENRYKKIEPNIICEKYKKIKENSDKKPTQEKKAQSKLVLLNNRNFNSNWYCIDVEYIKQYSNQYDKDKANFKGRFDIIALSKAKPHKVALIELKYGSKAMGGKSGIYKHVRDFDKFSELGIYEKHLKQEIIEIIKSQRELGLTVPFDLPNKGDLLKPDFYFITLDNNATIDTRSTPKQTMAGHLFKKPRWNCKRLSTKYCVENEFGDITKKNNKFHATFLFSKATHKNIKINDIIDGDYDEKISPE